MPQLHTLLTGLAFGESPRWHDDRLWFSDFGAQEVATVDLEGKKEVIAQIVQTVDLDRGCFACMLGGTERKRLFLLAAEYPPASWGPDAPRTGQVLTIQAPHRVPVGRRSIHVVPSCRPFPPS